MRRSRRSLVRTAVALAGAAVLGASPRDAAAEEAPWVDLTWSAPEGCPTGADVLAEVARLLGDRRPPGRAEAVAASVSRDGAGFAVHVERTGESETWTRELRGASCAAIASATALILALRIDPSAAERAPVAPPAPVAPDPAPVVADGSPAVTETPTSRRAPAPVAPAPAPPRAAAPSRAPTEPPGPSFRLLAWSGADVGSLPGVSGHAGVSGALGLGAQRVELGVALWPGSDASVTSQAGGTVDLVAGVLGTCRTLVAGRVELAPCAAIELGRLHAQGFGVTSPGEGDALWAAFKAGGELVFWARSPLGLALRLEGALPLARPRFVLGGIGPVHRPSAVAARGALGAVLRF